MVLFLIVTHSFYLTILSVLVIREHLDSSHLRSRDWGIPGPECDGPEIIRRGF